MSYSLPPNTPFVLTYVNRIEYDHRKHGNTQICFTCPVRPSLRYLESPFLNINGAPFLEHSWAYLSIFSIHFLRYTVIVFVFESGGYDYTSCGVSQHTDMCRSVFSHCECLCVSIRSRGVRLGMCLWSISYVLQAIFNYVYQAGYQTKTTRSSCSRFQNS